MKDVCFPNHHFILFNMNNKTLGIIGIAGAPFMLIDAISKNFDELVHTSISGVYNLIYISAWMCSMVALFRMQAAGKGVFGKIILIIQLIFLCLANCWNIYEIVAPGANTSLYNQLDLFWPVSNFFMLITAIAVAFSKELKGWKRYAPLLCGSWFFIMMYCIIFIGRGKDVVLFITVYSAIAWILLGFMVQDAAKEKEQMVSKAFN